MWLLKGLVWPVLAMVGIVVLVALFDDDRSGQLEVSINANPSLLGIPIPTLLVKNVGRETITILDATINNRPECKPVLSPQSARNTTAPFPLKVGESASDSLKCETVRAKIKTNKGTFEYTFRERN